LPSYNCGTEIDPILDHGIKLKYYRVNKDMKIDIDDLVKQIDSNTAAVLVIHYLGFPQPIKKIKKICEKFRVFLIEDCAHAFLSNHESMKLGSFGDISVFSIRKTLPIPNGGVLVINNKDFKYEKTQIKNSWLSTYFVSVELLKNRTQQKCSKIFWITTDIILRSISFMNYIFRLMLRILKKILPYKGLALIHINYWSREFNSELAKWKISKFSKRIMKNINYNEIKKRRCENFEYLLMNLPKINDFELIFKELPLGVCPLFFPIIVKDRKFYHKKFMERGISTFQYWQHMHNAVPWKKFPEAVFLKRHVLGLPIHQDISYEHLDKIIEVFHDISKAKI
jgi:dTDP-4-amino-4,6-dideoxygalactose transaminase